MLSGTSTPRASTQSYAFPQLIATSAAVLLAVASAATNVGSAISRHPDALGKAVSGGIALAVTGLLLVALPALLTAIRGKQWTLAAMAALAWSMAAAFSISAAMGTLGKPRLEAGMHASHDAANRSRLEAERKRDLVELATLAPARSASELNSLIAAKLATSGANGCLKVDGPVSTRICAEVSHLQSEASRTTRISALSGTIARVDGELALLGKPGLANSDAAAIAVTLAVVGIIASVDTLNVILLLIGVAILEIGPGIAAALAVGMRAAARAVAPMRHVTPSAGHLIADAVAAVPVTSAPAFVESPSVPNVVAPTSAAQQAADRVAKLVRDAGGELRVASRRELASMIGMSSPTIGRALAMIAGTVAVAATAEGLVLKIAA